MALLQVVLHNHGLQEQIVSPGERIAQLIITPVITPVYEEAEELNAIIEEFAEIPDLMDEPEQIMEQPAQEADDFAATLMFSLD